MMPIEVLKFRQISAEEKDFVTQAPTEVGTVYLARVILSGGISQLAAK